VNSYTTGVQDSASVAADASGNFVVVWQSSDGDGPDGIFGRRFDASGTPQGAEFRVNSYTTGVQDDPAVSSDANGNFVVVWDSNGQDGNARGIFGQRFNAAGVPQGAFFQANTYTTNQQRFPAVSSDAGGDFVVVWQSNYQDGNLYGVFGQRFGASGVAQGAEFRVNTYTTRNQIFPVVASDASGNFVVAWDSYGQDHTLDRGIFSQRFDSAGLRLGAAFRVNTFTTGNQFAAAVASDANGNFVIVWESAQEVSGSGAFGQRFDFAGVPLESEFHVNSYTTSDQRLPTVAFDANGRFVVTWGSKYQDGGLYGVFAQRYGDLVFKDGFESGDLGGWSSSAGGGDLSVVGAAAMGGTSVGLQVVVNDLSGIYVQDDSPAAENRLRVRFYFDPNGFDPGEADSHFRTRIFIAFDGSNQRVVTLVLKRQTGAYSIEARVRLNDGTRADTGFFPITDGPHFFEFDWQRASAPAAADGAFSFWVDNGLMSTLTTLDNDASAIEFVRMGAFGIKTGASGTLYFDEFASQRESFIGP
jgi:hypothetical protein